MQLAEGPLRERREGADALDLVAEELDPVRLAARAGEHVDKPTAHGDLAALLDALDAGVAGERQGLDEALDPRLVAPCHPQGRRPRLGWRQRLGGRKRRGADEPARRENLEGPGALADQVWRRLEPRSEANAAGRQEGDPVVADEPACRLGDVARIGVLGQEHAKAATELLVERREEERQRGLGHPRPGGQRRGECGQPFVSAQALDKRIEERTVQDECPELRFRGRPS